MRRGSRGPTSLKERITHVLDELRVVLPGTQALLGFQFVAIFSPGFSSLAERLRYVHLLSLCIVTLTTVVLMAPAARHRIIERGQDTEALHSFASRMLLLAMATLALGVCGDLFVVLDIVTRSDAASTIVAVLALAGIYAAWFGYALPKGVIKPKPHLARLRTAGHLSTTSARRPLAGQPKG